MVLARAGVHTHAPIHAHTQANSSFSSIRVAKWVIEAIRRYHGTQVLESSTHGFNIAMLTLCQAYAGPILALCWPYADPMLALC